VYSVKVLVLGGDGFVGSHLVDVLVAQDHEVTVFGHFPDGITRRLKHVVDRITLLDGDFANRTDVVSAVTGQDVIYHLISATNPAVSWNDPFMEINLNISYSVQLFEIASAARVRKVVYLSSGGTVYGKQQGIITEDALPRPFSPYGIGKLTIEHFLNYYIDHGRLHADIYRVGNAFGTRQPIHEAQGVIANWMYRLLNDESLLVYGDNETLRDYIFVEDVAYLITNSVRAIDESNTYNLGSGRGVSILELLNIFVKIFDFPVKYNILPRRDHDNLSVILDSKRLLSRFPDFKFMPLETALKATWAHVKKTCYCRRSENQQYSAIQKPGGGE